MLRRTHRTFRSRVCGCDPSDTRGRRRGAWSRPPSFCETAVAARRRRLWGAQVAPDPRKGATGLAERPTGERRRTCRETPPEHGNGEKKARVRSNPAGVIERKATGGNNAVDMRMNLELLVPGVEHTEKADLSSERCGVVRRLTVQTAAAPLFAETMENEISEISFRQGRCMRREAL
jgi:hypothetical protein